MLSVYFKTRIKELISLVKEEEDIELSKDSLKALIYFLSKTKLQKAESLTCSCNGFFHLEVNTNILLVFTNLQTVDCVINHKRYLTNITFAITMIKSLKTNDNVELEKYMLLEVNNGKV